MLIRFKQRFRRNSGLLGDAESFLSQSASHGEIQETKTHTSRKGDLLLPSSLLLYVSLKAITYLSSLAKATSNLLRSPKMSGRLGEPYTVDQNFRSPCVLVQSLIQGTLPVLKDRLSTGPGWKTASSRQGCTTRPGSIPASQRERRLL